MRLGKDISCILQYVSIKICVSNQSLLREPNTARLSRACLSVSCEAKCAGGQHPCPAPSGKWVEVMVCYSCWGPLLCRCKSSAATATANHIPQRSAYSIRNQFTVKVKYTMLHSNQQLPLIPSTLEEAESFWETY